MNTLIRKMFTASVVGAVLSSGAGLAMAETTSGTAYLQHSAEVGHIGWNWWVNSRPISDSELCTDNHVVAQNAETGPIAWDWWRHDHTHQQPELSASVLQALAKNNAETGHISWNWWKYPSSTSTGNVQQC
jgi:hypothetical protein